MQVIGSFYELNALLRAILVVKFECDPTEPAVTEIAWSPLTAIAANQVYDAAISAAKTEGRLDIVRGLITGRDVSNYPWMPSLLLKCVDEIRTSWCSWTNEERINNLRHLISPYDATETTLQDLVEMLDAEKDRTSNK